VIGNPKKDSYHGQSPDVSLRLIGVVCVQGMVDLLLHCEVACVIFFFFFRLGLSWVMPRRIVDLYVCWCTVGSTRDAIVCKMVLSSIMLQEDHQSK
jgi:hypothetical protein